MDLRDLEMDEIDPIEGDIHLVGSEIVDVFEHTYEFKVIKYHGAMKNKYLEK